MATDFDGLDDLDYAEPELMTSSFPTAGQPIKSSTAASDSRSGVASSGSGSGGVGGAFPDSSNDDEEYDGTFQDAPMAATSLLRTTTHATAPAARRSLQQSRAFIDSVDTQLHENDRRVARVRHQLEKEERAMANLQSQEQQLLASWHTQQERSQRAAAADLLNRERRAEADTAQRQDGMRQTLANAPGGQALSPARGGENDTRGADGALYGSASAPAARALLKIEQQISLIRQLVDKQQDQVQQQQQQMRLAERERDLVLMHREKLHDSKAAIHSWEQQEGEHARSVGAAHMQHVQRVVHQQRALDAKLAARVRDETAQREAELKRKDDAASAALQRTAVNLARVAEHNQTQFRREMATIDKEYVERTQSVMSLKQNIASATAEMQAGNERRAKARAKKQESMAAERADILAAGGNPEAVFNARAVRQEFATLKQDRIDKYKRTEVTLLDKVLYEQSRKHQDQAAAWEHARFQSEQMKTVGREVVNQRRADYMESKTIGQKDMLDPSGRLTHLFGSHHTEMKDWAFGLGLNPSQAVLERERQKYPHVATSSWLVPEELTDEEARAKLRPAFGQLPSSSVQGAAGAAKEKPSFPAFPGTEASLPLPDAEERERLRRERDEAAAAAAKEAEKKRKADKEAARALSSGAVAAKKAPAAAADIAEGDDGSDQEPVDLGPDEPARPRIPKIRARDGVFVELTAHEQRKLVEAKALIHSRLAQGEPREVCGKVYGGSKFLSSPAEIVFQDFEVGVQMEHTIVLTNVSFAFNHFKLLDLPPSISDFFEVIYTRPGRMSAGLTCSLRIVFRPERYEDIDVALPFLAETGPFSVPLKAFTKKLVVTLNPRSMLDFGVVVQGEERTLEIGVQNAGGLAGEISLHLEQVSSADAARTREAEAAAAAAAKLEQNSMRRPKSSSHDTGAAPKGDATLATTMATTATARGGDSAYDSDSDADNDYLAAVAIADDAVDPLADPDAASRLRALADVTPLLTLPPNPYIGAYAKTRLPVSFHPANVGSFEVRCVVTFRPVNPYDIEMEKQAQSGGAASKIYVRRIYPVQTFHFLLSGVAAAVPIYLARSTLDYQSVLHGQLYRDVLHVHNRSQRTLSIDVKPPAWCGDALTCDPQSAYVQGGGKCVVQWRLNSNETFWNQCVRWGCMDPDFDTAGGEQRMRIKLRLNVPEQVIPVMFELKAHLNNPELEFVPLIVPPSSSSSSSSSLASTISASRPGTASSSSSASLSSSSAPAPSFPSTFAGAISTLQFGKCFIGQSSMVPVQIKNHSSLIQKFAFAQLPKDFDAQPADGLVTLLPHSSAVRNLVFAPTAAVERAGDVVVKSSMGKEYRIRVRGDGRACPVAFSHTCIMFPPCPDHQEQLASLFVTNSSAQTQWLEFAPPPPQSCIRITPSVINLGAQQTARVQFEFCPKVFSLTEIPAGGYEQPCISHDEEEQVSNTFLGSLSTASALASASNSASAVPSTARSNAPLSSGDLSTLQLRYLPPLPALMQCIDADRSQLPEAGACVLDSAAGQGNIDAAELALPSTVRYQVPSLLEAVWRRRQQPALAAAADSTPTDSTAATAATESTAAEGSSSPAHALSDGAPRPLSPSGLARAHFPYLAFSRHGMHRLECFVTADPAVAPQSVFVQAETTTVLPRLLCEPRVADFAQVAIGRAEVLTLTLRNLDSTTLHLALEPLPAASPFTVLSAIKPIASGQSLSLRVEFRPRSEQPFNDELTFRTEKTQLAVRLAGRGVAPRVALEPPGPVIDVGDAMAGETISTSFVIRNLSVFPLPFEILTRKLGERNCVGFQEFHFVPSEGVVAPEGTCTVQVMFSPDHQSELYAQLVKVEVPNGTDAQLLQFVARGWDRQMFLLGGDASPFASYSVPPPDAVGKKPTDTASVAPVTLSDPFSFLGWEEASTRQVTVTFESAVFAAKPESDAESAAATNKKDPKAPAPVGDERVRTIALGACRAGDAAAPNVTMLVSGASKKADAKPAAGNATAGGSFTMELSPEAKTEGFFSVEPATANVAGGQRQQVTFKFNVAKYRSSQTSLVSHWAQTKIKCVLKGGLASNGKAEEIVEVLCRVFME